MYRPFGAALLALIALSSAAPTASATNAHGGASVSAAAPATKTSDAAPAPVPAAGGALLTRAVSLTRTQTKSVQRRLKVRADGSLGARTRAALRRYQRKQGLEVTGRPNIETLRKLGLRLADRLEARLSADAASAAPGAGASLQETIDAARGVIGTPYRTAGTTTAGFDCSGLTQWAFRKAGITLPRTSFQQYRKGESVARSEIQAGDLVFFNSAGSGASHVGIATSATKAISATSSGVKEHSFASGYWNAHYVGARRVTG